MIVELWTRRTRSLRRLSCRGSSKGRSPVEASRSKPGSGRDHAQRRTARLTSSTIGPQWTGRFRCHRHRKPAPDRSPPRAPPCSTRRTSSWSSPGSLLINAATGTGAVSSRPAFRRESRRHARSWPVPQPTIQVRVLRPGDLPLSGRSESSSRVSGSREADPDRERPLAGPLSNEPDKDLCASPTPLDRNITNASLPRRRHLS